jgi:hypothetical protein
VASDSRPEIHGFRPYIQVVLRPEVPSGRPLFTRTEELQRYVRRNMPPRCG